MALYKIAEFARKCGVSNAYVSVHIGRGKIIKTGKLIDDLIPDNAAFLEKHASKIIHEEKKTIVKSNVESNFVDPNLKKRHDVDMAQKILNLKKGQLELELKEIDKQKKLGTLIPLDLVKPIMSTLTHAITTEFKNYMDEFLREVSKKYNIPAADVAENKGSLVKGLNKAVDKSVDTSMKKIKVIVSEFSEKKGVGEHG